MMSLFPKKLIASSNSPRIQKPAPGKFYFANQEWDRAKWWRSSAMRKLYFYCFILTLCNVANGFDGSMMNGLQSLIYWRDYFGDPKGTRLGMLSSIMTLGSLAGLPAISPLCDKWGRKIGAVIGSVLVLLGVGLQAGSVNYEMFLMSRFVIGFGMAVGAIGSAPMLVAEIAHPQDRAILVTLFGSAYHLGSFISSWTTFGTLEITSDWAWRLPSLLQCCCTIIVLCTIWFIPESPRFYIARDNGEKAKQMLAYYHADGNVNDDFVRVEYCEIYTMLMLDRQADRSTRYIDFFRTPGNRKRLSLVVFTALFGQWSGNGIVSYYLKIVLDTTGITDARTQLRINGGLRALSLVVNMSLALCVDRLGRKPMFMASTIGMLFSFTLWTIFSARHEVRDRTDHDMGRGIVVMIYFFELAYSIKTGLWTTYASEILPYGLRAKGITLGSLTVLVALFFNQFVNPVAIVAIQWRYYIAYCIFLVFEVWYIWRFMIETRYTPLEEISRFFDGDEADVVALTQATWEKALAEDGEASGGGTCGSGKIDVGRGEVVELEEVVGRAR